jgi:hypothetical protein
MQNLQDNNKTENKSALLDNLSHLQTVFSLMSGQAELSVKNFENS